MKTSIRKHRNSVALVLGTVCAFALAACSGEAPVLEGESPEMIDENPEVSDNTPAVSDNGDEVIQVEGALGKEMDTEFTIASKTLAIDFASVVGDGEDPATSVTVAVGNGLLMVNGYNLSHAIVANGAAVKLKPADVKVIKITTNAEGDKVILDALGGALGASALTYSGANPTAGIVIDLAAAGQISLRATAAVDNWKGSQTEDSVFFEMTGDKKVDVQVTGDGALNEDTTYTIAMADGADSFNAMAFGAVVGTPPVGLVPALDIVAGLSTAAAGMLKPMSMPVKVYGGAGADVITGGLGADTLFGGADADTFKAATAVELAAVLEEEDPQHDGADTISGGDGLDKVDYSGRTEMVQVVLDGDNSAEDSEDWEHTGSGLFEFTADEDDVDEDDDTEELTIVTTIEDDFLLTDLEDITGGSGADILTGNAWPNKILGGAGSDKIAGGEVGSCALVTAQNTVPRDADQFEGGDGDDTFDMGADADCGATVTGGNGTDTVDYSARTDATQITLDAKPTSGKVADVTTSASSTTAIAIVPASTGGTGATLKTDIEKAIGSLAAKNRIIGGALNDELIGGDLFDYIDGLAGNDLIKGGEGDDRLWGNAGDDNLYGEDGADIVNAGVGNDNLFGGDGDDTLNGDDGDDVFNEGNLEVPQLDEDGEPVLDEDDEPVVDVYEYGVGLDTINGGLGYNKVTYAVSDTAVTVKMCNDAATKAGSSALAACTTAYSGSDDKVINIQHLVGSDSEDADNLTGTSVVDLIEGGAGDDVILGGAGSDQLYGDDGADEVSGEDGDDSIDGGDGDDALVGGAGEDICSPEGEDGSVESCEL